MAILKLQPRKKHRPPISVRKNKKFQGVVAIKQSVKLAIVLLNASLYNHRDLALQADHIATSLTKQSQGMTALLKSGKRKKNRNSSGTMPWEAWNMKILVRQLHFRSSHFLTTIANISVKSHNLKTKAILIQTFMRHCLTSFNLIKLWMTACGDPTIRSMTHQLCISHLISGKSLRLVWLSIGI